MTRSDDLSDRLLAIIRKRPDHRFDLKQIAGKLSIEADELGWEITRLHQFGYRFKKTANTIIFLSAPDSLTATEIGYQLKTKFIGQNIQAYRSVKSTNDIAHGLAEDGATEGTLIVAEEQTKGRGRFKRAWFSPPGQGIYMSLILRPDLPPEQAPALSIMTALSLAETIELYLPGRVLIKWPNDILLGRSNSGRVRKTAGILTELSADKNRIHFVIIGVGININQTMTDFPADLHGLATSVRRILRRRVNRVELLQTFLTRFEKNYQAYLKSGLKPMRSRIRKLSYLIGREIEIAEGRRIRSGRVVDIDQFGQLIIETAEGRQAINAGEVTVLKS